MITRLVRSAFARLAAATAMEDIAAEVAGTGDEPTADQVSRFMVALTDTSGPIREIRDTAAEDATGDAWLAVNSVVKDLLRNISEGVGAPSEAYTTGNMVQLVNLCRAMMERRSEGTDVTTKSPGIKGELRALAERLTPAKAGDRALWDDVHAFVEDKFAGYRDKLVNAYLQTWPHGESEPRSKLMSRREAEAQMMKELFDVVMRKMQQIAVGDFNDDDSDAKVFNTIMSSVGKRIQHGKVDDRWLGQGKGKITGIDSPRRKWIMYVVPLRGTEVYPGDRPDLGAIREWVNGNFHRKDLESQTPVSAQLPGLGGTVTAPSFKTELTEERLNEWMTAARGVGSLDAPVSEEGATVGETVGVKDMPLEEREEYMTDYLNVPKNRARIRSKILEYVAEAAATAEVDSGKLRDMFEFILKVKLGFGAGDERSKFEQGWVDNNVDSTAKGEWGVPHVPFRTEMIDAELWQELGRPRRKGWRLDPDQSPHERYRKPWTQTVLVKKSSGEQLKRQKELLDNPDPGDWELRKVEHTTSEEPSATHFVNWVPYSVADRRKDIKDTLDAYEQWFKLSVEPGALDKERESLEESHPLKGFDPGDIFKGRAKRVDIPMFRAVGQVQLSPAMLGDSVFPNNSGTANNMRKVQKRFVKLVEDDARDGVKDAQWVLSYIALKRAGRVASRSRLTMLDIVHAAVDALL